MSNAPHLLERPREGPKIGNIELVDVIFRDGLVDVYNNFLMGNAAEVCARECRISRQAQDEFAIKSYRRAQQAQKEGKFRKEIVAVDVPGAKGATTHVVDDEEPPRTNFDKIPTLKPAFVKDGTVTAANASKINDGAAALVVMSSARAASLGLKPIARIVAQASAAKEPVWFTTAPVDAIARVLAKARMAVKDIDLFEVNEAFAVVAIAVNTLSGLDPERVNVNGGAVALGHPIGASGARILVTLLHALEQRGLARGLAAICIGGGEASAVIVERI